ncbi:helix-turn-helix domain-containing protein [Lysinibacillus agricola]|uniref:Helix-turn-helix domain-containing protein n=1 Tax=Lysinibacillus agricola TaxID=2590012 RepID=A0ABX7ANQ7_9BACI|nr:MULTISPECIES: helix-turn-helix domain-containing protein [Lysinibacillus]KOS60874.1 hypothetical protein AN161_20030 [Lysinibacillus sp. FJAT-14222]QQP11578.1 helix-turn-helix domain-containing protein [Lysinibacillus agricola]
MNEQKDRIKELRKILKLSQEEFGDSIGLTKSSISNVEKGVRNVTEQHIKLITSAFNINEHWLRTGEGEMFVKDETFSLDEKAKKFNLSELEIDIMSGYMELPTTTRNELIGLFGKIYSKHTETAATTIEDEIDAEVESYRKELEAEKKARTLLASQRRETS